jgi:hypothetical protein
MSVNSKQLEFVICTSNKGYDDLEVWKVYRVMPDEKAAGVGCLRVVDESGEDYLYPTDCFVSVNFPKAVQERLAAALAS